MQGNPAIVLFNGTAYVYLYNLQGDVIALVDGTGAKVVEYSYDAWGKPTEKTGSLAGTLGTVQPFRYRRYVFDEETGDYYLRSRYYRPEWGRFLNADMVYDANLFVYCEGNPINRFDTDGCLSEGFYIVTTRAGKKLFSRPEKVWKYQRGGYEASIPSNTELCVWVGKGFCCTVYDDMYFGYISSDSLDVVRTAEAHEFLFGYEDSEPSYKEKLRTMAVQYVGYYSEGSYDQRIISLIDGKWGDETNNGYNRMIQNGLREFSPHNPSIGKRYNGYTVDSGFLFYQYVFCKSGIKIDEIIDNVFSKYSKSDRK